MQSLQPEGSELPYPSYAHQTQVSDVHFSSVAQSCLTLCNPVDCSMPGLPVHHQLLDFTQTHVHHVGNAIQPSHPLSSPSPPAFNLSQHQGLFQWVRFSHQVARVLEFQLQHQSFQWTFRTDFPLGWTWLDLLAVQGTLKSLLNTTVQVLRSFKSLMEFKNVSVGEFTSLSSKRHWDCLVCTNQIMIKWHSISRGVSEKVLCFGPIPSHIRVLNLTTSLPGSIVLLLFLFLPHMLCKKLESRLLKEISITSHMQMTPPLWQQAKRN